MTGQHLLMLLPLIVLAGAICVVLLAIAFRRNLLTTCILSCIGLIATLGTLWLAPGTDAVQVTPLLRFDGFSAIYSSLILLTSLGIALLSFDYFKDRGSVEDEYYVLMLSATLGGVILASATHFASFLLGLELLGISLYAMISYPASGKLSLEAALKYLILSGVSSAFLLFGIALLLAVTGTLDFAAMRGVDYEPDNHRLLLLAGVALMASGVMFKLSLVPFHLWTPDVYQGAPAPVSAFVATVSKGAVFAVLLRFFVMTDLYQFEPVVLALSAVAILSMIGGNLLALLQQNLKRLLAYSSIAHIGYLMVALIALSGTGDKVLAIEASTFFLVAYMLTTLGAFSVIIVMSNASHDGDVDMLDNYRGLFWRRPLLATVFSAMLLSLAGIPLTAGFIGKFYLFMAGVQSNLWVLVSVLVLGSGIGLFYYLRIIFCMTERVASKAHLEVPPAGGWVLISLTVSLIGLGVYPGPLVNLINRLVCCLI